MPARRSSTWKSQNGQIVGQNGTWTYACRTSAGRTAAGRSKRGRSRECRRATARHRRSTMAGGGGGRGALREGRLVSSGARCGRLAPGAVLGLARHVDDRTLLLPGLAGEAPLGDVGALHEVGIRVAVQVELDALEQVRVRHVHG